MNDDSGGRGLNQDGTIRREGSLSRVPASYAPVVAAARSRIAGAFDGTRLHSAYVYGSIPRGAAIPGVSDLDLLLALRGAPTAADEVTARAMEAELDASFDVIDGVGILLSRAETLTSELERNDLGFFVACLCTPLLGEDLAGQLPHYRPTPLLARETNGDLYLLLPRWRRRAAEATTDAERRYLSRGVARRLVRSGFTLVMPRWHGWTSDLAESAEVFARYYPDHPERIEQMRLAAHIGRKPSADPAVVATLIDDLAPWLAAEYLAVHGEKAPRP
ncbi:nucleotidyltransferase [Streptomyces sp. NBC_00984]|uniref:nucleotidyltransferase n=1 Tax=Streptomyces sp. NBC_00984 TaxID=2903700 RepID=UPI003870C0B3|nr:nucleotidyltransferase [Streptomyces sp. NBC_00984]